MASVAVLTGIMGLAAAFLPRTTGHRKDTRASG
jgi:hypothetical protein